MDKRSQVHRKYFLTGHKKYAMENAINLSKYKDQSNHIMNTRIEDPMLASFFFFFFWMESSKW